MEDNYLRILGVQDKEDTISNLIAFCTNESAQFAKSFVAVCLGQIPNLGEVRAYTRTRIADSGIPDIVLKAQVGDACHLIIVENKLKASEGKDQTKRYGSAECLADLKTRFEKEPPQGKVTAAHYVFLTLFPDQKPDDEKFNHIPYSNSKLVHIFKSGVVDDPVAKLLHDWAKVTDEFYSAAVFSDSDVLVKLLPSERELDASCLCFGELFKRMAPQNGLAVEELYHRSWTGRKRFIAVMSKPLWHGDRTEASLPFYIHVEPQFDCLLHDTRSEELAMIQRFQIYLHYELYPYKPESEAREKFTADGIERYLQERSRFESFMHTNAPDGFHVGGGWNQIGKMDVKLPALATVDQFQRYLAPRIAALTAVVDRFFQPAK